MAARRPKGFDGIAWDMMPEAQRAAEVVRHNMIAAAKRRKYAQEQRLQRNIDKRRRLIREQYEAAYAEAQQAYRNMEDADCG